MSILKVRKDIFPGDLLHHLKIYREEICENAKQAPSQVVDDFIAALSMAIHNHTEACEERFGLIITEITENAWLDSNRSVVELVRLTRTIMQEICTGKGIGFRKWEGLERWQHHWRKQGREWVCSICKARSTLTYEPGPLGMPACFSLADKKKGY